MKPLSTYITEKLKLSDVIIPKYRPATEDELKKLLDELIKERGQDGNFNDIDTSLIDDMSNLFEYRTKFNGDISKWNVSNVRSMYSMFKGASSFNCDISGWDTSRVENMTMMFCGAKKFKQDISSWNTQSVESWGYAMMFEDCKLKVEFRPKFLR